MEYYTKQYCKICGKTIKIDALDFLMNLDNKNINICDKCKKIKQGGEKNEVDQKVESQKRKR